MVDEKVDHRARVRPRGLSGPNGSVARVADGEASGDDELSRCCSGDLAEEGAQRGGAAWLLLLLPVACCGAPVLIGALAAASAVAWGAVGAVLALVLGIVIVALARKRAKPPAHGERTAVRVNERSVIGASQRSPTSGGSV